MKPNILPSIAACPVCESQDEIRINSNGVSAYIHCHKCGLNGPYIEWEIDETEPVDQGTIQKVIEAWNAKVTASH